MPDSRFTQLAPPSLWPRRGARDEIVSGLLGFGF